MDKEMSQEVVNAFNKILAAADKGRVTRLFVDLIEADPMRRALIASGVGSLLFEHYPASTITMELVEGSGIVVSIAPSS